MRDFRLASEHGSQKDKAPAPRRAFSLQLMNPLFVAVSVLALALAPLRADDSSIIRQLETAGGKVKQANGVVTEVTFTDCASLGDAEFRALGQLAELKSLTLYGGKQKLNDETVGHLLGLAKLESFSSAGARLSDAGLARLAALKSLRSASFFHLSFRLEGFTGKGFAAWKALPHFEKLTVAGMSMGDEGFATIAQISTLRDLSTWHTYQTAAGNAEIAKLPLTSLRIGQRLPHAGAPPSLDDAALATIAQIKTLQTLRIMEVRLTSAGLASLKALPALQTLAITESEVAEADLEALRKALPSVKIEHQPLTDEQRKKLEQYLK
jgi:hypothetical protein